MEARNPSGRACLIDGKEEAVNLNPKNAIDGKSGYLKRQPSSIENYEAMADCNCPAFATPRSWVTASDIVWDLDRHLVSEAEARVLLQGTIGHTMMLEIMTYHTKKRNLPEIGDIFAGAVKEFKGHERLFYP